MDNQVVEALLEIRDITRFNTVNNNSSETAQEIIIEHSSENDYIEVETVIETISTTDGTGGNVWEDSMMVESDFIESALSSNDESTPLKTPCKEKEPIQSSSSKEISTQENLAKGVSKKKYGRVKTSDEVSNVEDSAQEVRKRFEMGCECAESCFRGLNPEAVYKHRLNIAELTKEEHDMYLMGVTMACMSDPVCTNKRRERLRARPNYVYSGRKVCLSAFLYLENVTLYQLKRIRKHVMTQGVTPRIHGNHGKKPHNVFPLDIYRRATTFLKDFIQQHNVSGNPKGPILSPDLTRKAVHNTYKEYVFNLSSPNEKILGYSTFRHFMKEQFPSLRFSKSESGSSSGSSSKNLLAKQLNKNPRIEEIQETDSSVRLKQEISSTTPVSGAPLLLAEPFNVNESQAIIVAPLDQFLKTKDLKPQTVSLTTLSNSSFSFTTL